MMKRDANVEFYRCLCMLGVVCIHSFSMAEPVSHGLWALSCPFLLGFMMISGWFGIHFKFNKLFRLFGVVVVCSLICMIIDNQTTIKAGALFGKGYWYVWAYVFTMMFSPIVDGFVELCNNRAELLRSFFTMGFLLWVWSFFGQQFPECVPTIKGFGDTSGVVLLCVYILMRLIVALKFSVWLCNRIWIVVLSFLISGLMVFVGFRHANSIFAFAFAYSTFLLISKIRLNETCGKICMLIAPSMFSVFILHVPTMKYMTGWCKAIESAVNLPHPICQFIMAICIFIGCILIDLPRRCLVGWLQSLARRF